ncbi:MAG TPA: hypothetical protein VFW65_34045 [Pseudonocardiaceae bacterium]|nr:hypothetical protein [Pseudonocardiaceae bacterium]
MGYDLEWVELPPPVAAARDCFEAGLGCDHDVPCSETYHVLADPFQFSLNLAGMEFCRDGMRRAAMTYAAERPPFPDWPFASWQDWCSAEPSRRADYLAAERAVAAQTVAGMIGIPEFKFASNDSWIVGAQEICQALERYAVAPPALRAELEADDLWCQWLRWLRETIDHGGFTVG